MADDHEWPVPSLTSAQIESLARAIHPRYLDHLRADGTAATAASVPWDELPEPFRESSRGQAVDIARKLAAIGCTVETVSGPSTAFFSFEPDEIECLAAMEHDRWASDRERQGWTLGPERDDDTKRTPHLVPYAALPEAIKEYDREPVRGIPSLLSVVGLRAVRVRGRPRAP